MTPAPFTFQTVLDAEAATEQVFDTTVGNIVARSLGKALANRVVNALGQLIALGLLTGHECTAVAQLITDKLTAARDCAARFHLLTPEEQQQFTADEHAHGTSQLPTIDLDALPTEGVH